MSPDCALLPITETGYRSHLPLYVAKGSVSVARAKNAAAIAARRAAEATFTGKKNAEIFGRDGIGLEAGRMGRRLRGWIPTRVHVNTLISQSGLTTLARSRFLFRNNAYAKSAAVCFKSNTVGDGIRPSWKSPLAVQPAPIQ